MAFNKKTVKDIDLTNKTVLVRVDYNVLNDKGEITEDYRISAGLPTLKYLIEQNCKLVLISHAGRPDGKVVPALTLKPIAAKLASLIGRQVQFVDDCVGPEVEKAVGSMEQGGIVLLENLRFHAQEEANDPDFAKRLAALARVFVQDGFGVVHRAHASTSAITQFLPSVAGLLLEKEVDTITDAMQNPKQPLVAILGGAKVSDKIELVERFIEIAQTIAICGAMANTFLMAKGYEIGKSVYEPAAVDEAKRLMTLAAAKKVNLTLPDKDVATAKTLDKAVPRIGKNLSDVAGDEYILDLGPQSILTITEPIKIAGTVIWNGPVGMTELNHFKNGSIELAKTIIDSDAFSLAGGGDTAAFLEQEHLIDKFGWVSTGGGASLELMAGKSLPGVEALLDK